MAISEIASAIEAILFAAGEPVPAGRLASVLDVSDEEIGAAVEELAQNYPEEKRGIRLLKLENALQLCSAPEYADLIRRTMETRRAPKLSQTALEVLGIIAYYQPATRAYVEQIRGVDSSYTISALQERGLIEAAGKLAVPGRPTLFKTTKTFLRSFGLESLEELPPIPDLPSETMDKQMELKSAIEALQTAEDAAAEQQAAAEETPAEAEEETPVEAQT